MTLKENILCRPKDLSVFALVMITVTSIVNLRNLPIMASVGFSLVFFYLLAAVFFLIPSSLVCAEMASMLPQEGGVYLWVKEAFGEKTGFFAIWSQWFNNVIGFPTTLVFISGVIANIFISDLNNHKLMLFSIMMIIVWGCVLFNSLGIKASSRLNIVGALAGSIIPSGLIIALCFFWIKAGHLPRIDISWRSLFPSLQISNIAFFISVLNGYAGMQNAAFHVHDVINPRRNFPKAVILAFLLILIITIFGSLAIAIVVPNEQISLVSGVMTGFSYFFDAFHVSWALPLIALLIILSGISSLSAWFLGPARGLVVVAKQGLFPKWCAKENSRGMPINILLLQAVMATFLSSLFLLVSEISSAFWMLIVLTSQFTIIMDIMVFASVIRLRYKRKDLARPFKIPGGTLGLWMIPGLSIIVCVLAIIMAYFPPNNFVNQDLWKYEGFLAVGVLVYIALPIIIFRCKKRDFLKDRDQLPQ